MDVGGCGAQFQGQCQLRVRAKSDSFKSGGGGNGRKNSCFSSFAILRIEWNGKGDVIAEVVNNVEL